MQARARRLVVPFVALALLVSRAALADVPSGASSAMPTQPTGEVVPMVAPPGVTLPVLKRNDGSEYPRQAVLDHVHDTVVVGLVLGIDATGTVKTATVERAVGHGFDEAAVAAALKLEFEPARQGDKAVPVRIRFTYRFPPPLAKLAGRVFARASGAPVAGAAVDVRGADGAPRTVTTDAAGRWSLDLPFGAYHVTIAGAGLKAASADHTLEPGEEVSETDRLDAAATTQPTPQAGQGVPKKPGEEDVQEVVVTGQRPPREVTRRTLEQRELLRIPGTNGDAIKSLQNLPGVARPPGFLGLLIVRGSAPQDTSVFVDGTLIPIVYHFGGLSSVVPSEILEKIDFYPGNFSAQYGGAMGGIVDVGIRDPKKDKLHGMAQVDLIDARMIAEGPIFNTGWNFALAGRRSYVDLWLKPTLEATGAGVSAAPVYYDYQAILQKQLSKRSSMRFLFMGSDDKLDLIIKSVNGSDPTAGGGISTHIGFWRLQGRYLNRISDETTFKLTSAVGQDIVDFSLGDIFFHVNTLPITTRAEVSQKIGHGVTANFGLDLLYTPYDLAARLPPPPIPGQPPAGPFASRPPLDTTNHDAIFRPGVYTELEVTPWRGGRIVPGLRLDYSKDTGSWDFAPRVNARQDLHSDFPRTTLKGGVGVYYQPPQPQETNAVFGMPGLSSNRALHYGLGVEREFTRNLDVSLEGFYKQLDHLVTPQAGNVGTGLVYGVETLIRYKPDERFFGWIAYTLSRSLRRDLPGGPLHLSGFDQTHILTVLGSYRLGRGWELGGRFRLVSGNPYTPNTYGFYDENAGSYLSLRDFPINNSRLPLFHQLDIRIDKGWKFRGGQKFGIYLDVQNVYNQGNVEGVSYNYNATQHIFATGLPIIPSFGMRGEL